MRAVFGLVLVVGLGLAGFAIYMVQGHFERQNQALLAQQAAAAQSVPTVQVIAVNRQMTYGEEITTDDIHFIHYAEPYLPEGVFLTQEELFSRGPDQTRVVVRQMEANEPILAAKVTEPGESAGINSRLTPGTQAYTIEVDMRSAVSGFLQPGNRVDVYWTGNVALDALGGTGGITTKLIQQNLNVIAVDQNSEGQRSGATDRVRTVTVEATPAQVAALATAQGSGDLSLALNGYGDHSAAVSVEVDQATLLGIQAPAAPEIIEEERVCTMPTLRGSEWVQVEIPCTN